MANYPAAIKSLARLIPVDEMSPGAIRDFLENLTRADPVRLPASAAAHPKVYHATGSGTERRPTDLQLMSRRDKFTPLHVGTPRASLERVSRHETPGSGMGLSIPTSINEFNLHPQRPLLVNDMGDDFVNNELVNMLNNWAGVRREGFGRGITQQQIDNPWPVLDEAGSIDYQLFDAISRGEENVMRALRGEGYDAIPYINRYESPGSLSWLVLDKSAISPTGNIHPGIIHSGPLRLDGDQLIPGASQVGQPPKYPEDYKSFHGITPGSREAISQGFAFTDVADSTQSYRWIPGTEGDVEGLVSPMMRDWNFERFSPLRLEDTGGFGGRLNLNDLGVYRGDRPVELFHGTGTVFDDPSVFRPLLQMKNSFGNPAIPRGRSVFATNDPTIAGSHAGKLGLTPGDDYAPRTYPLHVSASNPLMYDDAIQLGHQGAENTTVRLLTKDGRMVEMPRELYHFDHLAEEGYDAVISPMMGKSGAHMYSDPFEIIVPNPAQLKSTTGNRGTYSFLDPDITRGVGGMIGAGSLYKLYGDE